MKKFLGIFLCLTLIIGLSAVSFAKGKLTFKQNQQRIEQRTECLNQQSGQQQTTVRECVYNTVSGSVYAKLGYISSITTTAVTIKKDNMDPLTFTIDANTKYTKTAGPDKTAKFEDLKVGTKALVMHDKTNKAVLIKIMPDKNNNPSKAAAKKKEMLKKAKEMKKEAKVHFKNSKGHGKK